MLQFFDTLTDDSGNSLLGATVAVTNYPSGTPATIYSSNGTANPIATSTVAADITGQVSFFVPDGVYTLTYAYKGTQYKVRSPVQLMDPTGFVAQTDTGGAANTYVVTTAQLPAQLYSGLKVEVLAAHTNTGASTLNVNATGAIAINQPGGSALAPGMVQQSGLIRVEYDGAEWQLIGSQSQPFYAKTLAEINANGGLGVTVVNFSFVPGDLRRYGAVLDGVADDTNSLVSALYQAQQTNGANVYLVRTTGGCRIAANSALAAITAPITIYGDEYNRSFLTCVNDITLFTFNNGASGSRLKYIQVIGKGVGAVNPLVVFNGSSYNVIDSCYIRNGGIGVQYQTGGSSCFLNSIRDSRIVSNNTVNIDAQAQTNNLTLFNVTFGGGPCQIGLRHKDSANLAIFGGDCEGVSVNVMDIDSTGANTSTGHVIIGCDFEANTCSNGDIRLGNTAVVKSIFISGITLSPGAGDTFFLNTQRVDGLTVTNCALNAGYTTSVYNTAGAVSLTNFRSFGNTANFGNNGFGGDIYIGCALSIAAVSFNESAGGGVSIDASLGNEFIITVTDNTAFAIGGPSNPTKNQQISITIRNTSGGALGSVSWNAVFKGPPTLWVSPANGFSRSVGLQYNGTNWVQLWQSAADVPN